MHRRLDYPGIGPEHSYLKDIGRAEYFAVTDAQARAHANHYKYPPLDPKL